jgi:O-antigen/teichoic acid export membrane protein
MAFGRIVLPVMTDVIAGGHNEHTATVLKSTILANAVVAIPPALLVSIFSHWIMRMYAVNDPKAWLVLVLVSAAATISAICTPVGQVMVAKGKNWYGWAMNLGWAIVYICGSYLMLGIGAVGVAAALLSAYLVHTTWVSTWVFRNINEQKIV